MVDSSCREHFPLGCCVLSSLPVGAVDSPRLWLYLSQQAGWALPLSPLTKTKLKEIEAHLGGGPTEVA